MTIISDEDKALFKTTIEQAKPIDKDQIDTCNTNKKQDIFTAYNYVTQPTLSASDVLSYAKNGVSSKIIKKMKRSNIANVSILDLHAQTINEACASMSKFIHHHQQQKFIQIIHGKGYNSENNMSILKTQTASFLKQHPQVLAFQSCPAKNGGTGAVFVLLK